MPLTYSIMVDIGAGFATRVLIKIVKGEAKEIPVLLVQS